MDPSDMFAQFVAVLSRHLNDHAVASVDLAARLFVSRSHLDRIVGAMAGETPVRFRRRILLERAAYRLRTSDISVLDAAIEAGYGSSEAFTRAFHKAYARSPTAWRSSASGVHIASPNGVHFYPPGGLRLPAREGMNSVSLVPAMVDHHVSLVGHMLDRASTLTDVQLDARIELAVQGIDHNPTIRSLLARLVGQMDMWNAAMANKPYDIGIERDESLASMRQRLDRAGTAFRAYAHEVSQRDRFDETFVDATGSTPYVFTAAGMIAHVLTYAAYRRTLVVGALASAGAPDLDDDPLTWFAPGQ